MPAKLRKPREEGKVNDKSVMSRLTTTPQTVMGTVSQMISACLNRPNSRRVTKNIEPKVSGTLDPSIALAFSLLSTSPPQVRE